jgi:hypothetical protein
MLRPAKLVETPRATNNPRIRRKRLLTNPFPTVPILRGISSIEELPERDDLQDKEDA